ncbi:undecaprenyl/decaprenyl-phosphate alpha-N-acetylglucosaminyl 1-phosphate transferase, partial [Streptomyces sp. SID89]|nr:undecaprenyl/decaprenyl-phosphate alpha-N-acetylglucosaminyl 1-phosphate transferase [Streptomyces sp. SID89]
LAAAAAPEDGGTGETRAVREHPAPVAAGVAGVNGATAVGARPRLLEGRKAGTSR